MWVTQQTKSFKKSYKKLSSQLQKQTDNAIINLATSKNPTDLGKPKLGKFKGYFAYEIGKSYRLIYKVINPQHIILLIVVGDHKLVYGKD